ncbi:TPA: hypothetical protein DCW38_02075 [candidate division WOR-3 bacterium]|uniref:Transglycosylase SLT domain-containing protein n=1 Tax=candidate division WOR-3 bacterium TaxID=2052148 RepID=A0A350H8T5_UNCW3|nr:hypothetical protein [candidate division WOR-3 bacterium]
MIPFFLLILPLFIQSYSISDNDVAKADLFLNAGNTFLINAVDSIQDNSLKYALKEIYLNSLVKSRRLSEIKSYFTAYNPDFEQAVKRVLSQEKDTAYLSYFLKLGYKIESKELDKARINLKSIKSISEYINKYPYDELSKSIFKTICDSLPSENLEKYLLANMKSEDAEKIFDVSKNNSGSVFLSALIKNDEDRISELIDFNIALFKKTDKRYKIKYSHLVSDSLRDKTICYYIGRNLEDKSEFREALNYYIKSEDEEAILRMIAVLKNNSKTDKEADSLLLNYNAVSPAFLYHRAKLLLSVNRKNEGESILHTIAGMFPQNLYSIRAAMYFKEGISVVSKPSEINENLLVLYEIFKKASFEEYFDRFVFRLVYNKKLGEESAAFLMDSLKRYNLAIYFAEKAAINKGFSSSLIKIMYPAPYLDIFRDAAAKNHIDLSLLLSVAREESSFNPNALSSAKARGIMQLMDFTYGEYYKDKDYFNIEKNINAGAKHLSSYLKDFPDNPAEGIMSYNAGKGNVKKWKRQYADWELYLEAVPFIETKNYVKKVLRTFYIYKFIVKVS